MKKREEHFDVVVVGGGPAGMMAAGRAAERGKRVLLLEKNAKLGEKLLLTGGGRCNLTNEINDIHKFLAHYDKAKDFLFSPFSKFGVAETFKFFEGRGLPLVTEARNRVFPNTQKASDVLGALVKYMHAGHVTVKMRSAVTKIRQDDQKIESVLVDDIKYAADSFILATGGVSAPETGSTGDGFRWLEKMGHKVKPSTPNVVPLKVKEKWVKDLSGVSLSFMKITFFLEGKKEFSKVGKILFTHFGLSGPLILNSSHQVKGLLDKGNVTATIDMYPHTNLGALEKEIVKVFDNNKNKDLKNVIEEFTPDGVAPAVVALLGPNMVGKKTHSVTKEDRKIIVNLLKAMPVSITGLMGYDWAVVSDGGINLTEVDTRTMKSKKIENLYVTGDLLDINRPSGGFSLQLCWTTGFVAGDSV